MIRTDQDMIDFIHTVLVIARDKGVAMETEIKHSPNEFFHGNIIEYHSVDTNKQVGPLEKKSPGGCMVGPTGPRTKTFRNYVIRSSLVTRARCSEMTDQWRV